MAAEQLRELDRLGARISALAAEKARIDAEIAGATAELRTLFEDRLFHSSGPRGRTNLADTTTATEVACLLRIPERSAHRLVQQSALLMEYHPRTLAALQGGAISWGHATALLHEYAGLPPHTAAGVEEKLLAIAVETTVPRLSYRARKLRNELHPTALDDRARVATEHRRVELEPADDAMAWLHVYLAATDAAAIDARLTGMARGLQTPAERRTLPQLRADVLADLLLTEVTSSTARGGTCSTTPSSGEGQLAARPQERSGQERVRAHINVTVPVLTLLGVDDAPADLEGYGPIPAEVARRLAAHAPSFTRLLTHPETGAVLSVGRTSYAVPADLKKWLRVRDRTCRHPGCSVPASRCELDHTRSWSQEGTTAHNNLAHLCRKHHLLKSEGVWHYAQSSAGVLTATSPGGRTYACDVEPPPG